jgi:hypothetical protein
MYSGTEISEDISSFSEVYKATFRKKRKTDIAQY